MIATYYIKSLHRTLQMELMELLMVLEIVKLFLKYLILVYKDKAAAYTGYPTKKGNPNFELILLEYCYLNINPVNTILLGDMFTTNPENLSSLIFMVLVQCDYQQRSPKIKFSNIVHTFIAKD